MNCRQMKILIVDDERSNLEVLIRILNPRHMQSADTYVDFISSNYTLRVAKSGQAALQKAAEEKPDLILLDVVMPDISGFEVLSILKESEATRDIPVIFITGLKNVENEEKGFLLGAVDYITKPFHGSLVRARVRTHLRIVEQMRTIEMLGLIDVLTNIPNRRGFDNQMTTEWARAIREKKSVSLIMIDIDHFKNLNDTCGHQQGDAVLQTIAKVLTLTLKRPADFAARWGGEEFAVILPDTDIKGALKIAEDICANIEAAVIPSLRDDSSLSVTASAGTASAAPGIDSEMQELIAMADKALYSAKESGRNQARAYNTNLN